MGNKLEQRLIIQEVRQYIFPVLIGEEEKGVLQTNSVEFLGTGFFITRNGIALSAAHVFPTLEKLGNKKLYVLIRCDGKNEFYRVVASTVFPNIDIAIVKIEVDNVKYFPVKFKETVAGTDLTTVGIPVHEVWNSGKEVRVLKGYATFVRKFIELNFPVPRGMSGSPVIDGPDVVGVLTGNVRSEELEDRVEEIVHVSDKKEVIKFVETKAVVNYGLAQEVRPLKDAVHEVFGKSTFSNFIKEINAKNS